MPERDLDQLAINTIRTLTVDAVQAAQSGHPGAPLALAPTAYLLYSRIMKHNPADPKWPDRDRFVLSAGHASMLLYASLHLSGYDLSLDQIKQFRQLGSETPGHPEYGDTPGVETTTGPLGQGFGERRRDGDGREVPAREVRRRGLRPPHLRDLLRRRPDGGRRLRGGLARRAPAARQARLPLRRQQDHDRRPHRACSFDQEDVGRSASRPTAGTRSTVDDGNDLEAIESAIRAGMAETERPTLIRLRTVIGYGSPRAGTRNAHSDPMPDEQVRATKEALGWDPDAPFLDPGRGRTRTGATRSRSAARPSRPSGRRASTPGPRANPELAADWKDAWAGRPRGGLRRGAARVRAGRARSRRARRASR